MRGEENGGEENGGKKGRGNIKRGKESGMGVRMKKKTEARREMSIREGRREKARGLGSADARPG